MRLQAGDESAFRELVTRHDRAMRRLALTYVQTVAAADEVHYMASLLHNLALAAKLEAGEPLQA